MPIWVRDLRCGSSSSLDEDVEELDADLLRLLSQEHEIEIASLIASISGQFSLLSRLPPVSQPLIHLPLLSPQFHHPNLLTLPACLII